MAVAEKKSIDYYLKLNYPVEVVECEEGGYFARLPDLPGCMTQAETMNELLANVREAKEVWLEGALEAGENMPLPGGEGRCSGRLLLRMPRSLHARLARDAGREGVSLNQYVVSRLSESAPSFVASDRPTKRPRRR
jgi:predicted RNase H-like HicB family nuclease